ncbi:hypothetical protein ABZ646_24010 [Streptomyces sp. NPDC007162]|uniref:hypothetical protein n=1 Tax=Streptomyces sp. NPDC007162 TaxID=3156917 RepID=UPI0033D69FC7
MFERIRKYAARSRGTGATEGAGMSPRGERRAHNLFEAAATYVAARAEDDQDRLEEASGWVSPEALSFGVSELACRAVVELARVRAQSPRTVARDLLGLPVA